MFRGVRRARLAVAMVALAATASACAGTATTSPAAAPDRTTPAGSSAATEPGRSPGSTGPTGAQSARCSPGRPAPAHDGPLTLATPEGERSYLLSVPEGYDGTTPVGLILNLHGSGSNKEQQVLLTDLPRQAGARGYAVVSPDGTGTPRGFNMFGRAGSPDDYAFLLSLIDRVSTDLCVDPDRIYSTGISNGSAMSMFLACREPYKLAAVALIAATVPGNCPADVRPSILAFHGTADPVVPYGGGTVNAVAAGGVGAPGAETTMANWASRDACGATPSQQQIGAATHSTWSCPDGVGIEFYSLAGAGHTWPGGIDLQALGMKLGATNKDVAATALLLDFFDAHRSGPR